MKSNFSQTILRRSIALPSDHGSWVFILSPLLIGLFAGERWTAASFYLIIAAMAAFLLRQPVSIAIKAYSGRRSRRDLPSARFWTLIYTLIGVLAMLGLALQGFAYLFWLALPGIPVFAWHLWLISRRAERRQVGVEVVGSGVLALAAPAGMWVGLGRPDILGWWLFLLTWLQSAASIVYAYLRLEQRALPAVPPLSQRLGMARRALLYTSFNLVFTVSLGLAGVLPGLIFLPYVIQWAESIWGSLRPAVGIKPTTIGFRQLAISITFTILFILTWNLHIH